VWLRPRVPRRFDIEIAGPERGLRRSEAETECGGGEWIVREAFFLLGGSGGRELRLFSWRMKLRGIVSLTSLPNGFKNRRSRKKCPRDDENGII